MRHRVVVTGVGLVTPLGASVKSSWSRLLAGSCGVKRIGTLKGLPTEIAAPVPRAVDGDPHGFDPSTCRLMERGDDMSIAPFSQFALAAAAEALDDARWDPRTATERERTGVAIGSGIGALSDIVDAACTLKERGARRVSAYFVPRMLVNMAAGQVSIRAGLRGPMAAPATACATGAHALVDAFRLLACGEADVMLAGGAEACIDPLAVAGFAKLRALSTQYQDTPHAASRPFDEGRDGFVLGEGGAVLVLETAQHATGRGAKILAELSGVGQSADAHHITSPPDDGAGALRAMRAAVRNAAVDGGGLPGPGSSPAGEAGCSGSARDPSEVLSCLDYVNAHATSTPAGDRAELLAISALASARPNGAPPVLVSSTKGATGHLLGAAGAVEAAFTVLALHQQCAPPTINLERADPENVPHIAHVTLEKGEEERTDRTRTRRPLRAALCNSFGFGGVNVSLLFESWSGGEASEPAGGGGGEPRREKRAVEPTVYDCSHDS